MTTILMQLSNIWMYQMYFPSETITNVDYTDDQELLENTSAQAES